MSRRVIRAWWTTLGLVVLLMLGVVSGCAVWNVLRGIGQFDDALTVNHERSNK